jgi:hypothetical protein
VGGRGRDRGRRGVESECVSVRGGVEKEREGGWTRRGWRESENDCEWRDSERGREEGVERE